MTVSVIAVPGGTLCELTVVTTFGCVSTRKRSDGALQGVVRPSVPTSPGTDLLVDVPAGLLERERGRRERAVALRGERALGRGRAGADDGVGRAGGAVDANLDRPAPARAGAEIVTLSWLVLPTSSAVGSAAVETWIWVFDALPVAESVTVCAAGRTRRWPFAAAAALVGVKMRGSVDGSVAGRDGQLDRAAARRQRAPWRVPSASVCTCFGTPVAPCADASAAGSGRRVPPAASTRTVAVAAAADLQAARQLGVDPVRPVVPASRPVDDLVVDRDDVRAEHRRVDLARPSRRPSARGRRA